MWRDERGSALVLVLLCSMLFLALAGALVTVARTEAAISATFRDGAAALSGAEAGLVRALADIAVADVNAALNGAAASTFNDGPLPGPRTLPDGRALDLVAAMNIERCGMPACTEAQLTAVTGERPYGVNNPRWQRYASGSLRDVVASAEDAPHVYVIVWVGDDPLETDGDPLADAVAAAPGHDIVLLRAVAYAGYAARRRIEVVAVRDADAGAVRVTSWRELRR